MKNRRILILGIGNPIRQDDGVGPVAVEQVRSALTAEERGRIEVRALDSGGWNLIPEIEGFDGLIIVDAYFAADAVPGRVRKLLPNDFSASERPPDSAHLIGLSDALRLSKNLGYHTPDFLGAVTVDVGESCMTFGEGLSAEIEAVVPLAASQILNLARGEKQMWSPVTTLDDIGFSEKVAEDGLAAVSIFQDAARSNISIVFSILDPTVPGGMGGQEALVRLQQIQPGAVVVAVGGYSEDPIMSNPLEHGFSDRITKPFRKPDVTKTGRAHNACF